MRELSISIGVVRQGHRYVLQRRANDPRIGAAGLIGAFGGKIEPGETAEMAVSRELSEETTLGLGDMTYRHAMKYDVVSDDKQEVVKVHVEVFDVSVRETVEIRAKEGAIVYLEKEDIPATLDSMTPATRYYFENHKEL